MYINCKTYFSFRYGTISTQELVQLAAKNGVTSLALTNINSTCDTWDFVKHCREEKIKPITGVEIRNGDTLLYILLAANNEGLRWIHEFLSKHLIEDIDFPEACPAFSNGFIIYPLGRKPVESLAGNERIGVCHWEITKLFGIDMRLHGEKFVIRQPVTVQDNEYYNLHRLLRCIDKNILLSKFIPGAQASPGETFLSPAELLEHFRNFPFMVTNTYKMMDACHIEMEFHTDKTKQTFGGSKEDDRVLLEKLATDGFQNRYNKKNKIAKERLAKELQIIDQLGFNSYFLINWDITRYAQSRGFYYVGRGSGANSIVAYCLRITDVDPIELNLYFERFLNPHRTSPPDFDLDFSYTDRDEVIDYIFKRYGKQYVSLLGSYSTFQDDAIIQQLGKVFGLPKEEYVQLQRTWAPRDTIQAVIVKYGKLLKGFPNILSLHACGMLISEKPISAYASLFMPPKGFPTPQLDMFAAENIGLNKFDILSQRGLGHIKECLRLIKLNKGVDIDIHNGEKLKADKGIATQIREANTIGCFYIESPAMRGLLKKLKCDDYLTLVAASSIIRPGVAQSGMMRAYIERYHDRSKVEYLHPIMKELLEETFGVMVFQEDVIKVAHYFAGLDLGQADILRRAMSSTKYKANNSFDMIRENYFTSCRAQGHDDALSAEIWRQMESFAGYSFNKAHSASYAVESYMSLYLKTYYPKEFMVAVINNFGGFYSTELYFLELLKTGGEIKAPCINNSDYYTNIRGNEVYTGLVHIKSLKKVLEIILEERNVNGPYLHLQDFIERINPGEKQVDTLISVGAFRFTGKSKKKLLWEANFLNKKNKPALHTAPVLFKDAPVEFHMPELIDLRLDDLYDEMEILGFTMSNPFDMVDDDPQKYISAGALHHHLQKQVTVLAYFIERKHVHTKYDDEMFFGTFVDVNLDWIDTVHFPEAAKNYPFLDTGFYRISGKVTNDFGVYCVEVRTMYKVGLRKRKYANL